MIGNILLYNLFMPQILNGAVKKVAVISSGIADLDWINDHENAPSKAAMNVVTTKFNAQYKKDGVLFLSVCPGLVETGHFIKLTPEQKARLDAMLAKFGSWSTRRTSRALSRRPSPLRPYCPLSRTLVSPNKMVVAFCRTSDTGSGCERVCLYRGPYCNYANKIVSIRASWISSLF